MTQASICEVAILRVQRPQIAAQAGSIASREGLNESFRAQALRPPLSGVGSMGPWLLHGLEGVYILRVHVSKLFL